MTEEEVSCTGKTRYLTLAEARRQARRIRRAGGPHFRPYDCRYCGLAHLGHPPGHATYLRKGQPLKETLT